jgi:hypothetical protein
MKMIRAPNVEVILLLLLIIMATTKLTVDASSSMVRARIPQAELKGTYYSARPDFRKCRSPFCGGFWLKALNQEKTVCGNGTKADECYVTGFDFPSSLRFSDEGMVLFWQQVAVGGIVCGTLKPYVWPNSVQVNPKEELFTLEVSAGWSMVSL